MQSSDLITSELEDQYANLFNLAVWPDQPPDFFEKCWNFGFQKLAGKYFPQHVQNTFPWSRDT